MIASNYGIVRPTNQAWTKFESEILVHRVKFPVLEKIAMVLNDRLPAAVQNQLRVSLAHAKHMSCYPIIGKLLQLRLATDLTAAYSLAIKHIIEGNEWYVCDIISERVFGEGSLQQFDKSYPLLIQMGDHENLWIQRSIGIATHYATKKGLQKNDVERLFKLMLIHGHKTQLYIKKGIGWAGKTIAKFHPDLIHQHQAQIKSTKLSKWFIGKVKIGLSMAKAQPLNL